MERETGFGPATFALARQRSTTEPLPRTQYNMLSYETMLRINAFASRKREANLVGTIGLEPMTPCL